MYWGWGGNFVRVTYDDGRHWWLTSFDAGVYNLSLHDRVLQTVAFGSWFEDGKFQPLVYLSTDLGRSWLLRGQLPHMRPSAPNGDQ